MQESKQVGRTRANKVACVHKEGNTFGKEKRKKKTQQKLSFGLPKSKYR